MMLKAVETRPFQYFTFVLTSSIIQISAVWSPIWLNEVLFYHRCWSRTLNSQNRTFLRVLLFRISIKYSRNSVLMAAILNGWLYRFEIFFHHINYNTIHLLVWRGSLSPYRNMNFHNLNTYRHIRSFFIGTFS